MISGPTDLEKSVHVDPIKKRVYLLLQGFLSLEQALKVKEAYQGAIAEAGPGYTVLSYFKDFTPGTKQVADVFASMIEMASKGGCRKAARLSSESVLGPLQMSRLAKVRASYPSRQCETWEQAEAYLDSEAD